MFPLDDTIAAIASPSGGAARGILRISGPGAMDCLADLFFTASGKPFAVSPLQTETSGYPNVVAGSLHLSELHSPLPCDAYLWPHRSYTGQPVVELHTVGSPPLLQMVLRAICAAGTRLAGRGEFTLRAFLAGRIDLTQAEAVLGVIDADDSRSLGVALGQLAGGLARPLHQLRDDLLDLLAHVEAGFDFADEDLPFVAREEMDRQLADAEAHVAAIERQMTSRAESVDFVRVVLIGRPNAGKSSLFNALAGGPSALVSHHPGTTRDYLTAEIDLDGVKCRLIDTAGIESLPHVEPSVGRASQLAAETQRHSAHVQVLCIDSTRSMDDWERSELLEATASRIVALTKCDAPQAIDALPEAIETSSLTGEGLELLRDELRRRAVAVTASQGDVVASTAARCRESLRLAGECLHRAKNVAAGGQEELAAAEIRVALEEIGKVVGTIYTDDILDRIFSRFCIGK